MAALYPAKTVYEVRAVLEQHGNKAITMRVSEHDTLKEARKAVDKGEFIQKITTQVVM